MLCNLGSAASTLELFLLVVCKIDKKKLFDLQVANISYGRISSTRYNNRDKTLQDPSSFIWAPENFQIVAQLANERFKISYAKSICWSKEFLLGH